MPGENKDKDGTAFLEIGHICNNNCLFCYEADADERRPYIEKSIDDIRKEMEKAFLEYNMVSFIGAEPTLRSDFVEVLKLAKEIGFKRVSFSTNGRQFKDPEFVKAVVESGVDSVAVSLLGGTAEIHDAETRAPGSFDELVAGLKNILPYQGDNLTIFINFTINQSNYKNVGAVIDLLSDLGVKYSSFRNTVPLSQRTFGNDKLIAKMSETGKYACDILEEKGLIDPDPDSVRVYFHDFLPCSLPSEVRSRIIYNKISGENRYIRIPLCEGCAYERCPGIIRAYADIYGTEEFKF